MRFAVPGEQPALTRTGAGWPAPKATGQGGSGCTLRSAIVAANTNAAVGGCAAGESAERDEIHFYIVAGGVQVIRPTTSLPDITEPVVIDGYTQPGASANTRELGPEPTGVNTVLKIELDGSQLGYFGGTGISLDTGSSGSVIRGLSVVNFGGHSSYYDFYDFVVGSSGNLIGVDATASRGCHGNEGVSVIGTAHEISLNVIADHSWGINAYECTMTSFIGNWIGIGAGGVKPGGSIGIFIRGGDNSGGNNVMYENVIANNEKAAIQIEQTDLGAPLHNWAAYNVINGNGALGIDLRWVPELDGANVPTPNDAAPDADFGPNGLQNFPGVNGDGKSDLLWHNPSSGYTDVWLMNGLVRSSTTRLLAVVGWRPVGFE